MFNKIGKYLRKFHRYLTPVFVIITIWVMLINKDPNIGKVLAAVQKAMMLTLAVTGTYLYVQIYYNKFKSNRKKRKLAEAK